MNKNRKILAAVVAIVVVVAAIGVAWWASQDNRTEVTVFAAASLNAAFTELKDAYEDLHPDQKITYSFDGSAKLKTQIVTGGANPDVFASADWNNLNQVKDANRMDNSTIELFVRNTPVIIVPANNPANIQNISDLAKNDVKLIIGDSTVPIGRYTRTILSTVTTEGIFGSDFNETVMNNVVSQESAVNNIVSKVSLKEADAGIVYKTDASSAGNDVRVIEIPSGWNVIAEYPIGMINDAPHSEEAQEFIDYVLSEEGQNILAKYGFAKAA